MGLALDEPRDGDESTVHDGITFVVGRDLTRALPRGVVLNVVYYERWREFSVRVAGYASC
ncbi:MAG: hypothetical protein AMXMBFR64_59240 [Myxococcales bacterium]